MSFSAVPMAAIAMSALAVLGAAEKPTSLACRYKTEHHMNSGSIYISLEVTGPEKKTWRYTWKADTIFLRPPGANVQEMSGTYELAADLVVFTGELSGADVKQAAPRAIRFGLNYGVVAGRVQFNQFFPAAGDTLRLHRKWFTRRDGNWFPLEERIFSVPADAVKQGAQSWQLPLTAERIRWDKDGRQTRERFAKTITYTKGEHDWYLPPRDPALPRWLGGASLRPHFAGNRIEAIDTAGGYVYNLAGIDPQVADIPELLAAPK